MSDEYGIIANVLETDRVFRSGAKAWLVYSYSGAERCMWRALSRSERPVTKVSPLSRFDNFRVAWIPDKIETYACGNRADMEQKAALFQRRADEERHDHPNRLATINTRE